MPLGHEDYGISQEREVVHAVTDLGELATRLGSVNTYNRSGNVVFQDGFEDGLNKWGLTYTPGKATIALSDVTARNGAYSTYFHGFAAGSNPAVISRTVGRLPQGKNGLELSFAYPSGYQLIHGYLDLWTGAAHYRGAFRFDNYYKQLAYYDSAGGWVPVDYAAVVKEDIHVFSTVKFVVDFANRTYQRIYFNDRSYDLAGVPLFQEVLPSVPRLISYVHVDNSVADVFDVYVDDIIFTQNEI